MAEQDGTQATSSLCDQLQITAEELQTRMAFLSFGEQDGRNIVEIHNVISSRVELYNEECASKDSRDEPGHPLYLA